MDTIFRERMYRWVMFSAPLTSLLVTPAFTFDPINLGKNIVVTFFSFLFLGLLISNFDFFSQRIDKKLILTISTALVFLVANMVFAPSPVAQKFWGVFGRNNGILSYLSLILILLCSYFVQDSSKYNRILLSLPLTGIPVLIYCLFQIAGKDPIKWSFYAPFATFGNVNFLSAFLGMASVSALGISLLRIEDLKFKLFFWLYVVMHISVILKTDSIQGLAVFGIGAVTIIFFVVRQNFPKFVKIYVFLTGVIFTLSATALFNFGPLARYIYQSSITFRFDYMQAAAKTLFGHPFFGVGMDGFGDWYRNYRGVISAFRTGLSRTSNSAHNIFLDIGAGGGFILLLSILFLFGIALFRAIDVIRTNRDDSVFRIIFAVWLGYLAQSLISINQVAIGIWGWIFTGVLLGYSRLLENPNPGNEVKDSTASASRRSKKTSNRTVKTMNLAFNAKTSLFVSACGFLGLVLSFLPFKADMDLRTASNHGDLKRMISDLSKPGVTAYHFSQVSFLAAQGGFESQAKEVNSKLRLAFPRDFGGWLTFNNQLISENRSTSTVVRKIQELDPLFFCIQPQLLTAVEKDLFSLPKSKQREISKFWNLLPGGTTANNVTFVEIPREKIEIQLKGMCS